MMNWDDALPNERQTFLESVWLTFQEQRATRKRMSLNVLAAHYARLFAEVWGDQRAVERLLTEVGFQREVK